jgi:cold shock protein
MVHGCGQPGGRGELGQEHTESVLSEGTVREWSDDRGWGVIDSAETPGGCWVDFSAIVSPGYRSLEPGGPVAFTYEAPRQDGFRLPGGPGVAAWRDPGSAADTGPARAAGRLP